MLSSLRYGFRTVAGASRQIRKVPTPAPSRPTYSYRYYATEDTKSPQVLYSGATGNALPPVPPVEQWKNMFPQNERNGTHNRLYVHNYETARKLVEGYKLDDGGPPKTVVEIYPGPGVLTRALLSLPRSVLGKLIIMEYSECYRKDIEELARLDDRVVWIDEAAYYWNAYEALEERGVFADVPKVPYDRVHPTLRMVGHIPTSVLADQWMSQILRHSADRAWLWSYGRMPLHILVQERLWKRLAATADLYPKERCKLSVVTDANCTIGETIPHRSMLPYEDHFWPKNTERAKSSRRFGMPMYSASIIPRAEPIITKDDVDTWDYILRNIFVNKTVPIKSSISNLAPGAGVLLPKIISPDLPDDERINPKQTAQQLTPKQWATLVKAFNNWPFKPSIIKAITAAEWDEKTVDRR